MGPDASTAFLMIKPCAVADGHVGDIVAALERAGFSIAGIASRRLTVAEASSSLRRSRGQALLRPACRLHNIRHDRRPASERAGYPGAQEADRGDRPRGGCARDDQGAVRQESPRERCPRVRFDRTDRARVALLLRGLPEDSGRRRSRRTRAVRTGREDDQGGSNGRGDARAAIHRRPHSGAARRGAEAS